MKESKWNTLPNEILTQILNKLSTKDLHTCLFINEKWLIMTQTLLYKEISLDIGFTNNIFDSLMLDTLIHSKYTPGRWVKKIEIKRLKVPDDIFAPIDPSSDPLHLLMTHCPLVEDLSFDKKSNFICSTEWQYLLTVFKQNPTWRLRNLPLYFDKEDYDSYYACAELNRASLTTWHLKEKVSDYKAHFAGFNQLNGLNISRHIIKDIVEVDRILPCLPASLYRVDIDFHVPKAHQIAAMKKRDVDAKFNNTLVYPNITKVVLKNFPLSRNDELLFFINKLQNLDRLNIKVAKGKPWPLSKISPHTLSAFLEYISNIPSHSVKFTDIDIMGVLDAFYQGKLSRGLDRHRLAISFRTDLEKSDKSTTIEIIKEKDQEEKISLGYNLLGKDIIDRLNKAKRTLYGIGRYIDAIEVSILGAQRNAQDLDSFILMILECCRTLSKLCFMGGTLSGNRFVFSKVPTLAMMTHLEIKKSHIETNAFTTLTRLFPHLESLNLIECKYKSHTGDININLFQTAIDSMVLSNKHRKLLGRESTSSDDEFAGKKIDQGRFALFFSVHFSDSNKALYYHGLDKVNQVKKFDFIKELKKIRQSLQADQIIVINLRVKSIKKLVVYTPKHHLYVIFK